MKKIFAMGIVLTMLLSQSVFAAPLDTEHWAYDYMSKGRENGWIVGGDYNSYINNVEAISILNKLVDDNTDKNIAFSVGNPNENITRMQWAINLNAVVDAMKIDTSAADIPSFTDVEDNALIEDCVKAGLMNGYEDGTFKPDNNITYAEAMATATRLNNIIEDINKVELTPEAIEAYNAYNEASLKLIEKKSYEADMTMDMKVSADTEDDYMSNMNMQIDYDMKIANYDMNDLNSMEMQMKMVMKMMASGTDIDDETFGQEMEMFFKDGYMYTEMYGEKIKQEMDYEEMLSGSGMVSVSNNELQLEAVKDGTIAVNKDGSKDLTLTVDMDKLLETQGMTKEMLSQMGADIDFGDTDVVISAGIDSNGMFNKQDMKMNMTVESMGESVTMEIDMKMNIKNVGNVKIEFPELEEYEEIEPYNYDLEEEIVEETTQEAV